MPFCNSTLFEFWRERWEGVIFDGQLSPVDSRLIRVDYVGFSDEKPSVQTYEVVDGAYVWFPTGEAGNTFALVPVLEPIYRGSFSGVYPQYGLKYQYNFTVPEPAGCDETWLEGIAIDTFYCGEPFPIRNPANMGDADFNYFGEGGRPHGHITTTLGSIDERPRSSSGYIYPYLENLDRNYYGDGFRWTANAYGWEGIPVYIYISGEVPSGAVVTITWYAGLYYSYYLGNYQANGLPAELPKFWTTLRAIPRIPYKGEQFVP